VSLALVVSMASCTHVPLTAPTKSVIALYASASPANDGSLNLIATVTEEAGTPVQNGTLVTFTTTLGRLVPTSAETTNGQATVKFFSDGVSGTATVSAFSGGATSGSGSTAGNAATLTIDLGAPANSIDVSAVPSSVPSGGTTTIFAKVLDASGNGLPNVLVAFTTTSGTLQFSSASTDSTGTATTSLTTTSKATVTAAAGGKTGTVDVTLAAQ
jgi:adhesin/invasin